MFDKKDTSRGRSTQARSSSGAGRDGSSAVPGRSGPAGAAIIGRSIKIDGTLSGDEDLRIEGHVSGTIRLPNHCLTIGKEGRIKADAYAKSMLIDGEVSGDLCSSESIRIRATAKITGNVLAARVSLEEGAHFKGSIDMDSKSIEHALVKRKAQAAKSDGRGPEPAETATLAKVESPAAKSGATPQTAADKSLKAESTH